MMFASTGMHSFTKSTQSSEILRILFLMMLCETYGFLNSRHDKLFGEGRISSSAELYHAGVYLDPGKLKFFNDSEATIVD